MTTRVSAPRSASARAATCVKKNTGKMTECVPFDRRVGGVPRSHFVRVVTPRRARSAGVRCDDTTRRDERANGGKRKEFFVLSVSIHAPREFFRFRTRAAASRCRICGRSPGGLALLELDGVHGDVAPDQHDGSARGAEHSGAALGLWGRGRGGKVAGEFSGVARCQKPARVGRADFGSGLAFGWRSAEVGGSGGTHRADVVHLLGVDVRLRRGRKRGWERSATDARRETRGTLAKYRQPTEGIR